MYGGDDDVPDDVEIDVITEKNPSKMLPPERFEIDLKKSWGVELDH
jgi:hypothetical protein